MATEFVFPRFNGRIKTFNSFVDAKHYIDQALQSVYMINPENARKAV